MVHVTRDTLQEMVSHLKVLESCLICLLLPFISLLSLDHVNLHLSAVLSMFLIVFLLSLKTPWLWNTRQCWYNYPYQVSRPLYTVRYICVSKLYIDVLYFGCLMKNQMKVNGTVNSFLIYGNVNYKTVLICVLVTLPFR